MASHHPKFCPSCGFALGGEVREVERDDATEADQFGSEHLDEEAAPSNDSEGEFAEAIRNRKRNRWTRS